MVDIDHFKRVNDLRGHGVGDQVIRRVAEMLAAQGEAVGRLGGEEFVILLKGRTMAEAVAMAERLRAQARGLEFATAKDTFTVTLSFGVSERRTGDSIDGFLRRADVALYAAKAAGRDRVIADDAAPWVANYDHWTSVVRTPPTEAE
jgi:diguanylate cyclase (GGDEF)-like protein